MSEDYLSPSKETLPRHPSNRRTKTVNRPGEGEPLSQTGSKVPGPRQVSDLEPAPGA